MTEQAKYLLRAPARDMERWKAEAELRGLTFADFCRHSLDLAVIDRLWDAGSLVESGPLPELVGQTITETAVDGEYLDVDFEGGGGASFKISPVEAAAAAVEGPAGAAASTGDLAAEPAVPPEAGSPSPVDSSEERADLVQTPAGPPASPELTINRPDLIDEARRLAGRMRR